ncbi:MAG: dynamin family protein [Streptosporangiales bacterium]
MPDLSALAEALTRLARLASADDRPRIDGLRERLSQRRLRVLVAGEAKRGKSTLVNALLRRHVLPTGVVPLTALPTTVVAGTDDGVGVTFADGHDESWPLASLADAVTEHGNPANRRRIAEVVVRLESPLLDEGVEIVDTPGTGSVYARGSAEAEHVLPTLDAAVVVLTADPPVSAAELALLRQVHEHAVALFVVLNKVERLDDEERQQARAFTESVLYEALGEHSTLYEMSAREGAADAGFEEFAAAFVRYLREHGSDDLLRAVAGHAGVVVDQLVDEIDLTLSVAKRGADRNSGQVAAFERGLADVDRSRQAATDLVRGQARRSRQALDDSAESTAARLCARARNRLEVYATEHAQAGAAQLAGEGRDLLVSWTADSVDGWRDDRAQGLQTDLRDGAERARAEFASALAGLRDTAAELLGVSLTLPVADARLVEPHRFFYITAENVDTAELLAGLVRRHLPGELGRRRVAGRLQAEAATFVPQQVGRARGDLQARLDESTRQLVRAVDENYRQATAHLRSALQAAATLSAATEDESVRTRRELAERRDALLAIRADLTE